VRERPLINRSLQAVIFDVDGVLIDSSAAHWQGWQRLAAELGRPVTEAQFRATFGQQNRDIVPRLFGDDFSLEQMDELGERKERYYRQIIGLEVPAIPGAAALVRSCHEFGLRCGVGSSGHPQNIALAIRGLAVESFVSAVVSGKDVTVGKPDPQVFLRVAARLDVMPGACVVIEDAPAGIDAALAAGMTAIGLTSEHPRERLSRAHLVVDRLDELSPDRLVAVHGERSAR